MTTLTTYIMKNAFKCAYAAPEVDFSFVSAEGCFAVSGGNENSGSKPGKFDKGFDWSNFDNFKF